MVLVLQSSERPQPGDLIEISRLTYSHWAVYVGDGYVVHLPGPGKHELPTCQYGVGSSLCDDTQSFYSVNNGKCTSPVDNSVVSRTMLGD